MSYYQEGRAARIDNQPETANPYPADTFAAGQWREGWRETNAMIRSLDAYR
jgi:hypothetical protein